MISASAAVRCLIQESTRRLEEAGIVPARHEAEYLLSRLLDVKPLALYLNELPVGPDTEEKLRFYVDRRVRGFPLQYLLGEAGFFGRLFTVGPGVFIPRPETEAVLEAALRPIKTLAYKRGRPLRILDAGCGSGCIGISLALELPACVVVGLEVSWLALLAASANIRRHGVGGQVLLLQGQWYQPFRTRGLFDVIVSNPPYIPTGRIEKLPPDVRQEPIVSLDGGPDGLEAALQLLSQAESFLHPGGLLVFECGEEQVAFLAGRAEGLAWVDGVEALQDFGNRPRGVIIYRR